MLESLQKKLHLPLPPERTDAEFDEAVSLLDVAIERLKIDQLDTGGLDTLESYTRALQEKYDH